MHRNLGRQRGGSVHCGATPERRPFLHFALFQAGVPLAWVVSGAVIYLLAEVLHQWDGRVRGLVDREGPPYSLVPLN